MTVRVYQSSDTGAPVLSGTAGALVGVLDACLVGTAGIAYGSTPSLGWTTAYTGTNLRAYRQPGGQQYYLKVRDDAPSVANDARVRGFETMTQVTATNDGTDGTQLWPTAAARATGIYVRKSSGADATYRSWIVVGDEQTFYMWTAPGDTAGVWCMWGYGDFYSTKTTSDVGKTWIGARGTENSTTASDEECDKLFTLNHSYSSLRNYSNRTSAGSAGGGTNMAFVGNSFLGSSSSSAVAMGSGSIFGLTIPTTHKIQLAQVRVGQSDPSVNLRGRMRGLWYSNMPDSAMSHGLTFSGAGSLAGKSFMIVRKSGNSGHWIVEISNTWESN